MKRVALVVFILCQLIEVSLIKFCVAINSCLRDPGKILSKPEKF